MHLKKPKPASFLVAPLPSMSLDTMVDNPGILSGRIQRVYGQQKKVKGKRENRSYKLVVKHRYTRTRRGIKRAFEICVQMMRKKGRCEDKIRVSFNTKKKEMEKKENRKIH
jgi:hypothetical protein